jgi:hypothetical protein
VERKEGRSKRKKVKVEKRERERMEGGRARL